MILKIIEINNKIFNSTFHYLDQPCRKSFVGISNLIHHDVEQKIQNQHLGDELSANADSGPGFRYAKSQNQLKQRTVGFNLEKLRVRN